MAPMNAKPMRITTTPRTRVMTSSHSLTYTPTAPAATMSSTNTSVKPATNRPTPVTTRHRPVVRAVFRAVPPPPARVPVAPALAAASPLT